MATQEERLAALEQQHAAFSRETAQRYIEMSMELTVLKGLVSQGIVQGREMREQILARMDARFDSVNAHLGHLEDRMVKLEDRLSEHAGLLLQILERLPEIPKQAE